MGDDFAQLRAFQDSAWVAVDRAGREQIKPSAFTNPDQTFFDTGTTL